MSRGSIVAVPWLFRGRPVVVPLCRGSPVAAPWLLLLPPLLPLLMPSSLLLPRLALPLLPPSLLPLLVPLHAVTESRPNRGRIAAESLR